MQGVEIGDRSPSPVCVPRAPCAHGL